MNVVNIYCHSIYRKGMIKIVRISKEESMAIRKALPTAHIAITGRHTSHKTYYLEESSAATKALARIRGGKN